MNRFRGYAVHRKDGRINRYKSSGIDCYLFCLGFRVPKRLPCRIDGPWEDEEDYG